MSLIARLGVVAAIAMVLASACESDTERPLSNQERKQIAQRYADTVRTLTPIVDSLCRVQQPALVAQLADSIFAVRRDDLERQRKRFGR